MLNIFDREKGALRLLPPSPGSECSPSPSRERRRILALLQDLPSWHLGVYQENVYTSKPLKCQAPRWAQTRSECLWKMWIVHFLPSFWQSRLPLKSSYLSHLKWQTTVQQTQGQFLSFLLEYSSIHLHTDFRTICFLTRFSVQYGTTGQKTGNKKCSVTLCWLPPPNPFNFFND